MGFARPFVAVFGAALFAARPALSDPKSTDVLVSGSVTKGEGALLSGSAGAVYDLRGGAMIQIAPGSAFTFEASIHLKLRKGSEPDTVARTVKFSRGSATVTIPAKYREQTAVLLRGPGKLSAVAKEGISTFVSDEDRTTAAARKGEMLVGVGNEWKPLREGYARTLSPADPAATPRAILPAPAAKPDRTLLLVQGNETGHFSTSWTPVKDATNYEVTVTPVTDAPRPPMHEATAGTTAAYGDLLPGAYTVSVCAVDRLGLEGAASERSTVRVVGLGLPEGASLATDGSIQLGHDQRVTLRGARGLEVSYGASPTFVGVPSSLGLAHNAATVVRLRGVGASEEATLRLEPRGLRANVVIGPRVARWPLDRVSVDVELYDVNGRAVPEDVDVSSTITVNLDPVAVRWVRKGRTLHGEIAPGATKGPWVVRAEIRDPRGELLGRDFLEVAPAAPALYGTTTASPTASLR